MASEPTDARLDNIAAAILPMLPIPAARSPLEALDSRAKALLRSIALAAFNASTKDLQA